MKISEINNIAYQLYLNYINEQLIPKGITHITLEEFMDYKTIFDIFYKDANTILRKEKISKINEELL